MPFIARTSGATRAWQRRVRTVRRQLVVKKSAHDAPYDLPVKRLVAGVVVVLAAGAALAVWLVNRPDKPTEFVTAKAAVVAVCHADPTRTPFDLSTGTTDYAVAVKGGVPLLWIEPGGTRPRLAILTRSKSGNYSVRTCGVKINLP